MAHNRKHKLRSLYLADEDYERVQAAAPAEGVSFQDFVRGLLNRYVQPAPPAPLTARVTFLEERVQALEAHIGMKAETPKDPDFSVRGEAPKTRRARSKEGPSPTGEDTEK